MTTLVQASNELFRKHPAFFFVVGFFVSRFTEGEWVQWSWSFSEHRRHHQPCCRGHTSLADGAEDAPLPDGAEEAAPPVLFNEDDAFLNSDAYRFEVDDAFELKCVSVLECNESLVRIGARRLFFFGEM